ncbi:hypothetical protein FLONG3_1367 [Fusarium longipes]|uniref:F-box domain-containing protein n=1 Tax=Fusarium longipes TaxID=694270 RepID=A0A395T723_9HYPO|nr:hypothetical protein FLONG3_1367 [Fusarium longipes]
MNSNNKPKLPVEIILLIIENLIPGSRPILPAWHVITQTLLNLTLVSKSIYPIASRLLWQNCLRIESKESLRSFLEFISQKNITGRMPCEAYGPTRLFLAPFRTPHRRGSMSDSVNGEAPGEAIELPRYSPVSPVCPELQDHDTAVAVKRVLVRLAPVLKGIIVDMPLRSLYPEDDSTGIRKYLREGFEALVNVEELVSINDELYLATKEEYSEPEVWTLWPKLQRLALYNVLVRPKLWKNMFQCPQLEMAVLSGPDAGYDWMSQENIKGDWCRAWVETISQVAKSRDEIPYQGREIMIALCDWNSRLPNFDAFTDDWGKLDPNNLIWIMTVPVDPPYDPALPGHANQYGEVLQDWVRKRALRGSLWEDVYTQRST